MPAARHERAVADRREVGVRQQLAVAVFIDDRTGWHVQHEVAAVPAGAIRSFAVTAAFALELGMKPIRDERVLVQAGDEVDRAAGAAVAAVGPAARDEFLAAKASSSRCRRLPRGSGGRPRR